ncbi:MAG: hypothetical protein PWP04_793 [Candidatus Atribacteria bacterium]|nr:hypothetical protein [Candidatus Atribacteria bacterium]
MLVVLNEKEGQAINLDQVIYFYLQPQGDKVSLIFELTQNPKSKAVEIKEYSSQEEAKRAFDKIIATYDAGSRVIEI